MGFPWETQDPFLFCVYHLDHYPKGNEKMGPAVSIEDRNLGNDFNHPSGWSMYHGQTIPGFPYHPHRGFETITIVNKGYCDHSDSLGAAGRFGEGDVQWMTAGRGVNHSEMFPLLKQDEENPLELFQIWLNLPSKDKFADPHFRMLWSEDISIYKADGVQVQVIAGEFRGHKAPSPAPDSWASDPENHVAIWNIHLEAGSSLELPPADSRVNRALYLYEGTKASIDDEILEQGKGAQLDPEKSVTLSSEHAAHFMVLQGKPIGEPVVQRGPFVMNTQEEIRQAMREYGDTQFGGWPWRHPDPVHDKNRGRFARYPDGKTEEPGD